jgi:ABC-2 type transport system permease protein
MSEEIDRHGLRTPRSSSAYSRQKGHGNVTATTASTQRVPSAASPGFGAALQSEWTKLRTVRATWIIVALIIGLSIGVSALTSLVAGLTYDTWGDGARASFDPVLSGMTGQLFRLILLIVLGATAVTSEYGSRMIRTTFIVNPRRTQVLAAKALIVVALSLVISAISLPGMFLASQAIFSHYGLASASMTDSDAARMLIVYTVSQGLVYTLIPFAIAWLLRSAASAIAVSIGFIFLTSVLSPLVPVWVQQNVFRYFPDVATDSLSGLTESDAATHLTQGPAIAVIAVWLVGMLAAAAFVLNRRDV